MLIMQDNQQQKKDQYRIWRLMALQLSVGEEELKGRIHRIRSSLSRNAGKSVSSHRI